MKLTLRARIGIIRFINDQRGGMDETEILSDIKSKVAFRDDIFDEFRKDLGNGQAIMDNAGIELKLDEEGSAVTLEKAERRKLLDGLKGWRGFTADDSRWNRLLITQLDQSLQDAPVEMSKTRKGVA